MFLLEDKTHAVLYTGDIRGRFRNRYRVGQALKMSAEPWWVNSITRNPVVIPFTTQCKTLDKIYMDTTFASRYKRHQAFPSKAEGIRQLLEQVSTYPEGTVFHFNAWTFGYEDVWIALGNALKSRVGFRLRVFEGRGLQV